MINISPSTFTQNFLHVKGKPFSFDGYEFLFPIYDDFTRGMVLRTGRQISKSTTIANKLVTWACCYPSFSSLFVTSTENHASVFSKQKLQPILKSPFIKKHYFGTDKVDQVQHKQLSNGSEILLRSCFLDAESIRGISADAVAIDEFQSILSDNIPIIEEVYTKSDHRFSIYSGTPNFSQNPIEHYWGLSTQNEWLVKCRGCNFWNYLDERCVQPYGLSCSQCFKLINAKEDGEWVSFNISGKHRYQGYRIPQIMISWIPWNLEHAIEMYGETADERGSIWYKYKHYSRSKFYNEVLGLPYDSAMCPVTLQDLVESCDPELAIADNLKENSVLGRMNMVAGIDWSSQALTDSYNVLTIGGYIPGGKFVFVYMKRFEGIEAELRPMLKFIVQKIREFNVKVVAVDVGMGADRNSMLRDMLLSDGIQLLEINHSGTAKADVTWNAKAKMLVVNRTRVMTEVFNKIKYKEIVFPRWLESQNYLTDFLNIYTDYNEVLRTVYYDHPQNKPDDVVHSVVFCHLAATIFQRT